MTDDGNHHHQTPPLKPLKWTYQNICILIVLPIVNMWSMNWIYTAAPLYWLDQRNDLLQYGAIVALGNLGRVLWTANLVTFVGDWTAAPYTILLVATSTLLVLNPSTTWCLWLGLGLPNSAEFMLAYRGLMHRSLSTTTTNNYSAHDSAAKDEPKETITDEYDSEETKGGAEDEDENDSVAVLNKALRILTISEVCSYASGTFIGGVLYQFGGWISCCWFMLAMHIIQLCVLISLPVIRNDMYLWWKSSKTKTKNDIIAEKKTDLLELESKQSKESKESKIKVEKWPSSIWVPIFMIVLAHFTNTAAYSVEWALYAVYFKTSFNWGGALIGFFQMFGDLVAALILAIINNNGRCTCCCRGCWVKLLCAPPYNMSILLLLMALLHVLMAQPVFWCAVLGQICMGTVWVFGAQVIHEMNVIYSLHDHDRYRKLAWASSVSLSLSIAITQFVALWLYETVDPLLPFWLSALFALLVSVVFTLYYCTRVGCFGGTNGGGGGVGRLREFEDEKERRRIIHTLDD